MEKQGDMNYFRYKHAAQTWAAYQQNQWSGRVTEVKELAEPTKEGARWVVEVKEFGSRFGF